MLNLFAVSLNIATSFYIISNKEFIVAHLFPTLWVTVCHLSLIIIKIQDRIRDEVPPFVQQIRQIKWHSFGD